LSGQPGRAWQFQPRNTMTKRIQKVFLALAALAALAFGGSALANA
jgi:hypothetical protein